MCMVCVHVCVCVWVCMCVWCVCVCVCVRDGQLTINRDIFFNDNQYRAVFTITIIVRSNNR